MIETWADTRRCELSFSLADPERALDAAESAACAADAIGAGFTLRAGTGGWNGEREASYSIAIVGTLAPVHRDAILRAIHAAGCKAVQVEEWDGASYRVAEVRP